ncbi:MAG: hypothetical protein LAO21_11570 [Acidobacteriia bacterium]|nr:hypothetical protein [Terriglobia bacterium]
MRRVGWAIAVLIFITGVQKAEKIDVQFSGYSDLQVIRGQTTEFKCFGKNLQVTSVEVSPAEGVSVRDVKESTPDPDDRRQQGEGIKVWSVRVFAEPRAHTGKRSIAVITPDGSSNPKALYIPDHVPRISNLTVLSAEPVDARLKIRFSVFDPAGDITSPKAALCNYHLQCGDGHGVGFHEPDKVVMKDPKNSVFYATQSFSSQLQKVSASGTCILEVFLIHDDQGGSTSESNKLTVPVEFAPEKLP